MAEPPEQEAAESAPTPETASAMVTARCGGDRGSGLEASAANRGLGIERSLGVLEGLTRKDLDAMPMEQLYALRQMIAGKG